MEAPDDLRVSRAMVVSLGPWGVNLPFSGDDPRVIGLPELRVIAALAAGNEVTGPEAQAFVEELVGWGLVVPGEPAIAAPLGVGTVGRGVRAPVSLDDPFVVTAPTLLRPTPEGFEALDHDGRRLQVLSPREVALYSRLGGPTVVGTLDLRSLGFRDDASVRKALGRGVASEIITRYDADDPLQRHHNRAANDHERLRSTLVRQWGIDQAFAAASAAAPPEGRVRVVPVEPTWRLPPLALGLLVAYARQYDGGALEQHYAFSPRYYTEPSFLQEVSAEPAIFLFSNYVWTHTQNLELSRQIKAWNPRSITIHGGPDTPRYRADCEAHFAAHPHIDVMVRGEGEATFAELLTALAGRVGTEARPLSALADVPGLSFRDGDAVVHSPDRDRVEDLDTLPSPMLTGLFDGFGAGPPDGMVIETNRGCPYGCTFCDWGSATLSRIRKFDLDRVYAELEWVATNKIRGIMIADANFGIFERDVDIARKIAELKATYGYPELVGTNYAKNTVKHLKHIIETFADGGIVTEGIVSLQTMDDDTLLTIRRKNIKVEKYNDLAEQFRINRLPLTVELMMGLPGATPKSLRDDLQQCINRDVRFRLHVTQLLPNSPMNEPEYREANAIVAKPGELVQQTSSYTLEEWHEMYTLGMSTVIFDVWGVVRHLARHVRQAGGMKEMELYERLVRAGTDESDRWPAMAYVVTQMRTMMLPPVSWKLFIDELHEFLVTEIGLVDDSALRTALEVQHALLPAAGRSFPDEHELAHDFGAWHEQVMQLCESGRRDDWETVARPLSDFGPASFRVDDPADACRYALGESLTHLSFNYASWDLESPVARARLAMREGGI